VLVVEVTPGKDKTGTATIDDAAGTQADPVAANNVATVVLAATKQRQ